MLEGHGEFHMQSSSPGGGGCEDALSLGMLRLHLLPVHRPGKGRAFWGRGGGTPETLLPSVGGRVGGILTFVRTLRVRLLREMR